MDSHIELLQRVMASGLPLKETIKLAKDVTDQLAQWTQLRGTDRNATYELVARHVQSAIAKLQGDLRPSYATGPGRVPDEFIMEEAEKARERLAAKKAAGK